CGGLLEGEVCFFFFERKRGHRSWVSDGISGVCFSVRSRPARAGEILVEVLEIAPPAYTEARLASIDLTEIQPAEYRADVVVLLRSEERRVGKECRSRWGAYHEKKNETMRVG